MCLHPFSLLKFLAAAGAETVPGPWRVTGLAEQPADSAVGQPLIGATWLDEDPRVCQRHARTRRQADTPRQGTP